MDTPKNDPDRITPPVEPDQDAQAEQARQHEPTGTTRNAENVERDLTIADRFEATDN